MRNKFNWIENVVGEDLVAFGNFSAAFVAQVERGWIGVTVNGKIGINADFVSEIAAFKTLFRVAI